MAIEIKKPIKLEALRENQADLKALKAELQRAERAGFPMTTELAEVERRMTQNSKIRDSWYPGQTL